MWKQINPNSTNLVYVLDPDLRNEFPSGVLSASFTAVILYDMRYPIDDLFPARLSASIVFDETTFKVSVEFYDEPTVAHKIEARVGRSTYPADDDESLAARELRKVFDFQRLLQTQGYITFPSCQRRLPKGRPKESDPNRALEEREKRKLLLSLDAIFTSMETMELKSPLREVGYYQGLVRRLLER